RTYGWEKRLMEFEKHLSKKSHVHPGRVDHPKSNGKLEKLFDIFEKKVKFFSSIDEFFERYTATDHTEHSICRSSRHRYRCSTRRWRTGSQSLIQRYQLGAKNDFVTKTRRNPHC